MRYHVVCHAVSLLHDTAVCNRSAQDSLGMLDVLDHPIYGVSLGLLVDPEHEAYQELAIAKDPDRESEIQARVD